MWLKDLYDAWRNRRIDKKKRWWEDIEKGVGDGAAEDAEDFFNSVRGICPYCGINFDMPGNLRRHILSEHPGDIEEDEQKAEYKKERKLEEGK